MNTSTTSSRNAERKHPISFGALNWFSIVLLLLGTLIVFFFGTNGSGKTTIFIWMLACLLTGTFIGFLFGIPKIVQNNQSSIPNGNSTNPTYQQQVNTNLTEISDWLTKIIVGLGLIKLTKIPPYLSALAKILAAGLSQPNSPNFDIALAFSYGIIITYIILGFLFGYITTRMYLAGAFSEADQKALAVIEQKTQEAVGKAQSALQKAEFALITPSDNLTQGNPTSDEGLLQLVSKYNDIRGNSPSSNGRTTKMTEIVKAMVNVTPSLTNFDLSKALLDGNNGNRLAGYIYLYTNPDHQYIEQLTNAIIKDPTAFGQYWGIQALGKVINLIPASKLDPNVLKKLKIYHDQLDKDTDRRYELGKILQL